MQLSQLTLYGRTTFGKFQCSQHRSNLKSSPIRSVFTSYCSICPRFPMPCMRLPCLHLWNSVQRCFFGSLNTRHSFFGCFNHIIFGNVLATRARIRWRRMHLFVMLSQICAVGQLSLSILRLIVCSRNPTRSGMTSLSGVTSPALGHRPLAFVGVIIVHSMSCRFMSLATWTFVFNRFNPYS